MMDCEDCQNYKPAWTPPVARFTPKTPLPDGAVCVHRGDRGSKLIYDWYWTRSGRVIGRHGESDSDLNECAIANFPEYVNAIRALGLPVWGIDINCGGECAEEFWTDAECEANTIPEREQAVGIMRFLPYVNYSGRRVAFLRRYHGTRKDGVSVDGWIVKPVAVEQPKPAPGQPCPACGQPVPEPIPPAPFKVGDWVRHRTGDRGRASFVERIEWIGGLWKIHLNSYEYFADDYEVLRPALPPLSEKAKRWVAGVLRAESWAVGSLVDVARLIHDLYPHEFGVR